MSSGSSSMSARSSAWSSVVVSALSDAARAVMMIPFVRQSLRIHCPPGIGRGLNASTASAMALERNGRTIWAGLRAVSYSPECLECLWVLHSWPFGGRNRSYLAGDTIERAHWRKVNRVIEAHIASARVRFGLFYEAGEGERSMLG